MTDTIQLSYPQYFLVFACLIAICYAFFLYFRENKFRETKSWFHIMLSLFRFFSVFGIILLLLNPFIKQLKEEQKDPIIVIAEDRSESIASALPGEKKSEYLSDMDLMIEKLSSNYEVKHLSFGESVRNIVKDSFIDQTTNLSQVLELVDERFGDQNLGAVILSTDGIFNEGKSPLYTPFSFTAPIINVALGDTTIKKDLFISNLLHNKIAYLGDKFSLQVDVQGYNCAGSNSQLKVYRINGDKKDLVKTQSVKINSNNFFKTYSFEINAAAPGNITYRAELNSLSEESTTANNRKRFYMEVLDARQKILIVANAPHPDLRALKKIITTNKNYEVELKYASDDLGNITGKDIIILHDLPSAKNNINTLLATAKKRNTPLLYILASQTDVVQFNSQQSALKIAGSNRNQNDVQAIINNSFNAYKIDELIKQRVPKFVPLKAPFGEYTAYDKADVLLYQKIGTVDTKFPLALFLEEQNQKIGILAGEGIWRWNLFEYTQYETQEATQEFIIKMIQFLSQKEDKRKFRTYTSQNTYKENENILFDAQLYNKNYELINDTDAFLTIKDSKGKKYDYTFSKANNYFKLDAGKFPEGNYSYSSNTKYNGEKFNSTGKFTVQSIEKEQFDLTARHNILFTLSEKTQGKVFYPNQIANIGDYLKENQILKPLLVQSTQTEKLLNMKWLALIIAFLLFLEWFLRRYFGHY